jgi:peroxiredoxin
MPAVKGQITSETSLAQAPSAGVLCKMADDVRRPRLTSQIPVHGLRHMKTTFRHSLLLCTAASGLTAVGCATGLSTGRAAPDFKLDSLAGPSVTLSQYKGNPVLLSFWSVGCGFCRAESSHLKALHEKYAARGLRVVTVHVADAPKDRVAKFVENQKLPYVVLLSGGEVFAGSYGGGSIPQTYLLDRGGQIVYAQVGWSLFTPGKIEHEIESLLKP